MKIIRLHVPLIVSLSLFILLVQPSVSPVQAGENEDFRFSMRLKSDGMFVAAAEEFLRFADKYPRSVFRADAIFNAGEAYMQAGEALRALDAFGTFLDSYPGDESACKARFYRGRILAAMKRYREAAGEFLSVGEEYVDCPLASQAALEAGECLLSAGDPGEAAGVLRRLFGEAGDSDLTPRVGYSLALSLINIGRDLEADRTLERIVSGYPSSPVAALALIKLGDRSLESGEMEKAEEYFRKVMDNYREKSLREKALFKIIDIQRSTGSDGPLLDGSREYLEDFPDSPRRGDVFMNSIEAARRLGKLDEALELIGECGREGAVVDSTGAIRIIEAGILSEKGKTSEALEVVRDFRRHYAGSPHIGEALRLEAGLLLEAGAYGEASRVYHLVLLEGAVGDERLSVLERLASVSSEQLADTLSALVYLDMIMKEDGDGERGERALWRASRLREALGDVAGAEDGYRLLEDNFPFGPYAEDAGERLDALSFVQRWGRDTAEMLERIAASDKPRAERLLDTGVVLADIAGDTEGAIGRLKEAVDAGLPDSLAPKAHYYIGRSHIRKYELDASAGRASDSDREKALSKWLEVARNFTGTRWGGSAHRGYLELKFSKWNLETKLSRLDEFYGFYGDGDDGWWALGRKMDFLYDAAKEGESWAADSALVICGVLLGNDAPREERMEAALKKAYLMRIRGESDEAVSSFVDFISMSGSDPRSVLVLYDLGELYMRLGDYENARDAYLDCIDRGGRASYTEKCMLRLGDCYYYLRDFDKAAGTYGEFTVRYPSSDLSLEAAYRQALALESMGRSASSDSIIFIMAGNESLERSLRIRVIRRAGRRLYAGGDVGGARKLIGELVSLEPSAANLELFADILFDNGEYKLAAGSYSRSLRIDGADTCSAVAGRARSYYRIGEIDDANRDMMMLTARCPGLEGTAAVLLEKGIAEVERGQYAEAQETLDGIRESFGGTDEAARALFHLAVCDMKRGGYEDAAGRLSIFLRESPNSKIIDKAYFKLASAYYASGNPNLAVRYYALAAEASSDEDFKYMAMRNLGNLYQDLEEWERAASTWQRITELFPAREGIVETFFNLGFCYNQAGRHRLAYEVYTRIPAVAADEEQRGRAHYWAGMSLKSLGECSEAVREFLRVPYLRTGGMWAVTSKLEAAACYEMMGNRGSAEKIYNDVISAHGAGSDWGSVAKKALDRLQGAADPPDEGKGPGVSGGKGHMDGS